MTMSLFANDFEFAPIARFNHDPDVVRQREAKVAAMKQEMGSAWAFHPDNFIKFIRSDTLLTKWLKTL
jgi:hypothetical protein